MGTGDTRTDKGAITNSSSNRTTCITINLERIRETVEMYRTVNIYDRHWANTQGTVVAFHPQQVNNKKTSTVRVWREVTSLDGAEISLMHVGTTWQ